MASTWFHHRFLVESTLFIFLVFYALHYVLFVFILCMCLVSSVSGLSILDIFYNVYLTPPLFVEVPAPCQESDRSCICVLVISTLTLSMILIFDFGILPTICFLFFMQWTCILGCDSVYTFVLLFFFTLFTCTCNHKCKYFFVLFRQHFSLYKPWSKKKDGREKIRLSNTYSTKSWIWTYVFWKDV